MTTDDVMFLYIIKETNRKLKTEPNVMIIYNVLSSFCRNKLSISVEPEVDKIQIGLTCLQLTSWKSHSASKISSLFWAEQCSRILTDCKTSMPYWLSIR